MRPIFFTVAIPVAGLLLTGCTLHEVSVGYEDHPRHLYRDDAVVVQGPPPPAPDQVVVVPEAPPQPLVELQQAPPPVRVERIPPSPGIGYVWVPGYWVAQRDRWVWVSGHYELPPRRGAVWVEPRYERHGDTFRFSAGFWR